jgi:hypothetical protein
MMLVMGLFIGCIVGVAGTLLIQHRLSKPYIKNITGIGPRRLPRGVRRGQRPDVRRIVLRPVNKDEPPSRISQALFRQRPTRKLEEHDKTD